MGCEKFKISDIAQISSYEEEPGSLVIAAKANSFNLLEQIGTMTVPEIYGHFSSEQMPENLAAAYRRNMTATGPDSPLFPDNPKQPDVSTRDQASSRLWNYNQFINFVHNDYPPYYLYDYQIEWLNRTGYCSVERDVDLTRTYAYSYRGTVTHRLRRKKISSYVTIGKQDIAAGCWSCIRASRSIDDHFRGEVYNSDGDGFHFVYYGHDW